MDLDTVTAELYGAPPDAFTTTRNDRAKDARRAGDTELAKTITALRKPSAAAWVANQLVRQEAREVNELLEVGEAMRSAQDGLDADAMRRLAPRRHALVDSLVQAARHLALEQGRPLSDATVQELLGTLEAAFADAGASEALRSGRLTGALRYSGFGAVDVTGLVVTPLKRRPTLPTVEGRETPRRRASPTSARTPRSTPATGNAETRRARREAEGALAAAERDRGQLDRHRRQLRDGLERQRRRIATLEEQLGAARQAERETRRDLGRADKDCAAAEREVVVRRRRLEAARKG
jgi:hypothetical protein